MLSVYGPMEVEKRQHWRMRIDFCQGGKPGRMLAESEVAQNE